MNVLVILQVKEVQSSFHISAEAMQIKSLLRLGGHFRKGKKDAAGLIIMVTFSNQLVGRPLKLAIVFLFSKGTKKSGEFIPPVFLRCDPFTRRR